MSQLTADEVADGVVVLLNAIDPKLLEFKAQNPETVPTVDREVADLTVDAYGFAETETSIDRGDACSETRVVAVLVQRPLDDGKTRKDLLAFCNQLKNALRETTIGSYRWQANETVVLWDVQTIKTKRQFVSLFRATYFGIN